VAFDLIIRDGEVLDGTGTDAFRADVGVGDGRIAFIGRITERADEEIDAEGHVITPGFIDGHTHMDAQVMWDAEGSCSSWHGVTTAIMGNCGFSLAPSPPSELGREQVIRNIERSEDIAPEAMAAGIDWTWSDFAGYLDAVDRAPKSINYAAQVGHSALRVWAMGERAFTEVATDDDLDAMRRELASAIAAGAAGFTTSRSRGHLTPNGEWVTSRRATWSEVDALVATLAETGGRMFEISHGPGAEGDGDRDRLALIREQTCELAVKSGVLTSFYVPAEAPYGYQLLKLINDAAARGARIFGQTHPRGVATLGSFRTQLPFDRLQEWRELRALPIKEQRARLQDPETRARLVRAAEDGSYGEAFGGEMRKPQYDRLRVIDAPLPPWRTVAEHAQAMGRGPADTMIQLGLDSDFVQFFSQGVHEEAPEDTVAIMKHPRTAMTFSDSGAHVGQIMDTSIHTHMLGHWVRNEQAFTLREAIRMMTSVPAGLWGLHDRGQVREGWRADLNIIDPARVSPLMPTVVYDLPGGARRLLQRSQGILATVVGGGVTVRDAVSTGVRSGQLLRYRDGQA
jgi:N-acyl-D-aspartate/D-glutamate deacylase